MINATVIRGILNRHKDCGLSTDAATAELVALFLAGAEVRDVGTPTVEPSFPPRFTRLYWSASALQTEIYTVWDDCEISKGALLLAPSTGEVMKVTVADEPAPDRDNRRLVVVRRIGDSGSRVGLERGADLIVIGYADSDVASEEPGGAITRDGIRKIVRDELLRDRARVLRLHAERAEAEFREKITSQDAGRRA